MGNRNIFDRLVNREAIDSEIAAALGGVVVPMPTIFGKDTMRDYKTSSEDPGMNAFLESVESVSEKISQRPVRRPANLAEDEIYAMQCRIADAMGDSHSPLSGRIMRDGRGICLELNYETGEEE